MRVFIRTFRALFLVTLIFPASFAGAAEPTVKPSDQGQCADETTMSPATEKPGDEATSDAAPSAPLDQAELERRFERTMSGATLVGTFTVAGEKDPQLHDERYEIRSVRKLKDNRWLFETRIKYGTHDLTVPLALTVEWAGDTPVITLTDLPVPGFGTFTSRVLIYRDQYAGTWSGADHGGHLFGRIEHAEKGADAEPKEKSASAPQ